MNIISNCCIGAYIYKHLLHTNYKNPFMSSAVTPKDFLFLINHFNEINFNDISIEESFIHGKRENPYFKLKIQNSFSIHYTHYFENINENFLIKSNNVYSKNIKDYLKTKYFSRLKRMNNDPKFIICDNKYDLTWTQDEINELLKINNKRILIFTDKLLKNVPSNIVYIHQNGWDHIKCAKNFKNDILKFINT